MTTNTLAMTRDEAERRARENYEKGVAREKSELDEMLRCIAKLFGATNPGQKVDVPAVAAVTPAPPVKAKTTNPSSPVALAREAIKNLPPHFVMGDVARWLEIHHPRSGVSRTAISSSLHKLWKQGEIHQEKPGQGKNDPAKWKRVENEPASSVLKLA